MSLAVELAPGHKQGLLLANPVMPAAGSLGYGLEYEGLVDIRCLGALVTTPTTLRPCRGRSQARFRELENGLLLDTADQNPGLGQVLRRYAPRWARGQVPVVLSIAGQEPSEVAQLVRHLSDATGIWGLELSLPDGLGPSQAREMVSSARAETWLPLWAKPPLLQAVDLAGVCVEAGANALTVGCPPQGMHLDLATDARWVGRLYGPTVKPLALWAVAEVVRRVPVPVIACGGIHTPQDALEFLAIGARALQVDSAIWVDPRSMLRIVEGIEVWMGREISGASDQPHGGDR